jgi:hypothetical protein
MVYHAAGLESVWIFFSFRQLVKIHVNIKNFFRSSSNQQTSCQWAFVCISMIATSFLQVQGKTWSLSPRFTAYHRFLWRAEWLLDGLDLLDCPFLGLFIFGIRICSIHKWSAASRIKKKWKFTFPTIHPKCCLNQLLWFTAACVPRIYCEMLYLNTYMSIHAFPLCWSILLSIKEYYLSSWWLNA